jgi:competence protein ComEC
MPRVPPLAALAAGFVAGAAAARALDPPWLLAGLAAAGGLALLFYRHPALALVLGFGLGGLRQEWAETREPIPLTDSVEGTVDGPPRVRRALSDPDAGPSGGSFRVGRVLVRHFGRGLGLIGGERVRVRGRMSRPKHATNPGQFDYGDHLERQGIDAVLVLESWDLIEGPPAWSRARAWVRSLFDRGMRPDVAALQAAIVLGRREDVPEDLVANLQRSGTAHLLAISGQNLVIVLTSLWTLLVLAGVGGRTQSLLLLALLGLYVLLTGVQVSVARSFLMISAFLGADLCWRRRDPAAALGAAAIALCAWDPGQVADTGFQLSFAAVMGLAWIAPVFQELGGRGGRAWTRLRTALAVSIAAWLATAPVVLATFNLLTPGIVLSNLFLVPLLTLEFMVGLLHLALAPLGLGILSGSVSGVLFDLVRAVSSLLTSVPFSYVYAPPPTPALIALYYAGLAGWTLACRTTRPRAWKAALAAILVVPLGLTPLRHRAPGAPELAVLDVGRGSCAYLEWPDGRNLMVDCGSLDYRDPGASVAAKFLWHRGVTRLDTLVLSHPDEDHVNGAASVIELFRVRRLLVTRAFRGRTWPPGVEVREVERASEPLRIGDLEILGPPVWEKFGDATPVNETSIVLRAAGVLFPGDVEDRGVEELLGLPDLRARVLILPHHGKHFRRHEEFVRRVDPDVIVVSAPRGYSSPRVLDALPFPARLTGEEGWIRVNETARQFR